MSNQPSYTGYRAKQINSDSLFFILQAGNLLLKDPQNIAFTFAQIKQLQIHHHNAHQLKPNHYIIELEDNALLSNDIQAITLKKCYPLLSQEQFNLLGKGAQILYWDKCTRFCGCCGAPTQVNDKELFKLCSQCEHLFYPKYSPAVIVLVRRNHQMLLARSPHFPEGIYSTLAGFIEPGETAEQAIVREIKEEVSIDVKNIRYFGSQPWPFPNSFMLGFNAEYAGGDLIIDNVEISDARWFDKNNLPKLPSEASIARKLINHFLNQIS